MTSPDIDELLARHSALSIEALASISITADSKPYFLHTQESFPYFVYRMGGNDVGFDSEDFDRDVYTVIGRLVIGHLTQGYVGETENKLYQWIPVVKTYFNQREHLQTASGLYTTAMLGLIRSRVTSITGFRIFEGVGIDARQVGTEFVHTCEFDETIEQEYP